MASTNIPPVFTSVPEFDKQIKLTLFSKDGTSFTIDSSADDPTVLLGARGRKPTIRLKGKLIPSNTLLNLELRVTNLYLTEPLSNYKKIEVQAGYKGNTQISFGGTVLVAFQELPGPDGVTCFQFLLGNMDDWTGAIYSGQLLAGESLAGVINFLAGSINLTPVYQVSPDVQIPLAIDHNDTIQTLFAKLEDTFHSTDDQGNDTSIKICPYGSQLLVYRANVGLASQSFYRLDFITHASHNSAGYEIHAPWAPQIRPGDIIVIDPKYFRESFGGSQVATGTNFRVLTVDFDFATTDDTNSMSLVVLTA